MKINLKLSLLALLLGASVHAQASDSAMIGPDCAASHVCVTDSFRDIYAKILPMAITPTISLTDYTVNPDISIASVLLTQTRAQLIEQRSDETDLYSTLGQYARQMTCGVSQSIEQLYLKTGGQIIWKYYFSDGEYFDSLAFSSCN